MSAGSGISFLITKYGGVTTTACRHICGSVRGLKLKEKMVAVDYVHCRLRAIYVVFYEPGSAVLVAVSVSISIQCRIRSSSKE